MPKADTATEGIRDRFRGFFGSFFGDDGLISDPSSVSRTRSIQQPPRETQRLVPKRPQGAAARYLIRVGRAPDLILLTALIQVE